MSIKIKVSKSNCLRCYFDKERKIGVEVTIEERRFLYYIEVRTYNPESVNGRIETFRILKLFGMKQMRKKIDRAFGRIKHKYLEWGIPEELVRFPWKNVKID